MTHRPTGRGLTLQVAAALICILVISALRASAQTSTTLNVPGTQVTDTYVRGGAYAAANYGTLSGLRTSAGATADDTMHALLKFDTENTLAAGASIRSATLTLTVKSGGADVTRTVGLYGVTSSFIATEANWTVRRSAYSWSKAGGDFGCQIATASVSNVAGAKVTVDVTTLVRAAVTSTGSRYTRIGLADVGAGSGGSLREFYASEATDPSVRPVLTVVSGPTPVGVLRVMQYNTHHGGWGTDGVYDPSRIADWVVKVNPDIVSLNEIEQFTSWSQNQDQTVIYQNLLQQKTGVTWYKVFMNHCGSTTGNGNLILSKYPFTATTSHLLPSSRAAVDATIVVNGRLINFTSTHLDNASSSNRIAEVADLVAWETNNAEQRIIAGDFNANPGATEIVNMTKSYIDTWAAGKASGIYIGNGITHGTGSRIDYIFQSKGATNLQLTSVQIFNTADANGVMPSDHQPVLAVFQVK